MNIVFIAGIGHSGSTLLDFMLGAKPKTFSVGEIDKFINDATSEVFFERYLKREKYPCSCGKRPGECPFWSKFRNYIDSEGPKSYQDTYHYVLSLVQQQFGASHMIDSSKNIHALRRTVAALSKSKSTVNLKVIHLTKDVRNLAASNIRSKREKSVLKNFKKWSSQNIQFEKFLNEQEISFINVGYEELAISTGMVMNKISAFLGLSQSIVQNKLHPQESHILIGNPMRLDEDKSSKIEYDYHWFTSFKIPAWYTFTPNLHQKNMKWVYSNIIETFNKKGPV
jgi:hypothetical protein